MTDIENYREATYFTPELKLKTWGEGEWVTEPDSVSFTYRGLKCEIQRNTQQEDEFLFGLGHLCGYVYFSMDHPWADLSYDNIPCEVHGELTFKGTRISEICIGFDCGHSDDLVPISKTSQKILSESSPEMASLVEEYSERFPPIYRNIRFCIDECKSMVDQALEACKDK